MDIKRSGKIKFKKRLDEALYEQMLDNFLEGKYPEKTEFNPITIAEEYDISVTPVNLTLKRMYHERLIDRTKGGKYLVPQCTVADINNLCDARLLIEQKCLFDIIDRDDEATVKEMIRHAEACKQHAWDGNSIASIRSDLDLHKVMVEGCANVYLSAFYIQIRNKLISWNYIFGFDKESLRDASSQHIDIIEAIVSKDKDRAYALLVTHVEETRARIADYLSTKV